MPDLDDFEDDRVVPHEEKPVISDERWAYAVSKWTAAHLHGSPVAQNTEAWNHLMKSLPHLKGFIHKEL